MKKIDRMVEFMRKEKVKVCSLKRVKEDIFLLGLKSPYLAKNSLPGQFLHIKINKQSLVLRRPLSIHRVEKGITYVLFKVRGEGTRFLSRLRKGSTLNIIGPLGRGFNFQFSISNFQFPVILVAGGIGVAPLLFLAQRLRGGKVWVFLGAKSKEEILCRKDFQKLGGQVFIATEDGSLGFKGKLTHLLKEKLSTISYRPLTKMYACGPVDMFLEISKILKKYPQIDCQISFEQFMGCGIGVCRGCVIKTKQGFKRVCREGPVFNIKEVF
ncbi:MAG: dihydroorotate dehydrogenase electron transfer subunit [Candidatus Omnitrophota bacterium]|nr:MAG: dihydroorotate dehydrogenase electron transfer subunit [Candidatus Omnitrophota bacterium]RKY44032.1 MAG: dihydroorotate dehydrogenase electron transfer subunit [Candidatus Omnitrophota bacterium]